MLISNIAKLPKISILAFEVLMNVTPLNIVRAFEYNNRNSFSLKNSEKKNVADISSEITEKFEPEDNAFSSLKLTNKISPQYNPSSPVVKTGTASRNLFEVIHYEDILEKNGSELQSPEVLTLENVDVNSAIETTGEIGKGFYLTLPKKDLEKMSNYNKAEQDKFEKYKAGRKTKTGMLVNIIA